MKGDVVLADELEKLHVFRVFPPRFPLRRQGRGYGYVADGGVEPDIEDLVFIALFRDRDSPLQVPGYGPFLEAVPDPGVGHLNSIAGPETLDRSLGHPVLEFRKYGGKIEIEVMGLPHLGFRAAGTAAGFYQVRRVKQFAAVFALISPGIIISAVGTGSPDKAIRQKALTARTVELFDAAFFYVALPVAAPEDGLDNIGLFRGGSAAELVKGDVEPFVDIVVDNKIAVAQLLGRDSFLQCPGLGGGSVLIGSADVEGFVALEPAETGKNVRRQNLYKVAEMGNIINIGQRRGDQSLLHSSSLYGIIAAVARERGYPKLPGDLP